MRLSTFILSNLVDILREWEAFASTIVPLKEATRVELRDHAAAVLKVIASDLSTPQAEGARDAKSKGHGPILELDTAAETHAEARMSSGLNGDQVMMEFRALRASVIRLWALKEPISTPEEIEDMIRFNEAIDQAQSESMARYSKLLRDAQTMFLAILGHDVRSPLGAVSMGAQVLLHDQTLPSKVLKVGLRILNSSKRVDEIVRDLLDFSTSHLGDGIPIDPYTVDLSAICANVVEEARTFHPDRTIEFTADGDLIGTFDGARLAQAFSNLISNAIQHGFQQTSIHVSVHGDEKGIHFEVQNDGEVIPETKLRALFDPIKSFAIRPPSERTVSRVQNLGLGLYVVKEIVRAHEGDIAVSSTAEAGVKFSVDIPRITPQRRMGES